MGGGLLSAVNEVVQLRGTALDRLRPSSVRAQMIQHMQFRALLNVDQDPDSPWPVEDPYRRYGVEQFTGDAPILWFEPLPPMLPNLEENPKLPPTGPETYTLVLDLDETLVHYFEHDGMGNYDIRPGMHEFLERMHSLGYELVIFTAATQDYADWVIDQIDPGRLIHYRLYRQHALPWGPIFVKDMSLLGRDLDRTLIIDNVQENFMLQPSHGIFIMTWYDDPHDTALFALTPLLDELIATRAKVPEILDKYRDQIPTWAGFDQYSQLGGEFSEFDLPPDDGQDQYGQEYLQPIDYNEALEQEQENVDYPPAVEHQPPQPSYIAPKVDSLHAGHAAVPPPAANYAAQYHQPTAPASQVAYTPQPRVALSQHQQPSQQHQTSIQQQQQLPQHQTHHLQHQAHHQPQHQPQHQPPHQPQHQTNKPHHLQQPQPQQPQQQHQPQPQPQQPLQHHQPSHQPQAGASFQPSQYAAAARSHDQHQQHFTHQPQASFHAAGTHQLPQQGSPAVAAATQQHASHLGHGNARPAFSASGGIAGPYQASPPPPHHGASPPAVMHSSCPGVTVMSPPVRHTSQLGAQQQHSAAVVSSHSAVPHPGAAQVPAPAWSRTGISGALQAPPPRR